MRGRVEMIGALGVGKTSILEEFRSIAQPSNCCIFEDLSQVSEERRFWAGDVRTRTYYVQTAYYLYAYAALHRNASPVANVVISDFSLLFHHYGYSAIFRNEGLLDAAEFRTLEELLGALEPQLPPLIGVVHCIAHPSTTHSRVLKRGRGAEGDISPEFIGQLSSAAASTVAALSLPVLKLDLDRYNSGAASIKIKHFLDRIS